ncbi:Hypothetical protein NTJ_07501 [Nesidiocoris tenuis]|uniref:Secreted protein n=1 Tax=Nesidiocoris tenuis TaxID=355587 RepID=A0ABN7AR60_9HEMI|nr:Hypothetical protein NTJ_07501 [Nesidiocoris tenuis]
MLRLSLISTLIVRRSAPMMRQQRMDRRWETGGDRTSDVTTENRTSRVAEVDWRREAEAEPSGRTSHPCSSSLPPFSPSITASLY